MADAGKKRNLGGRPRRKIDYKQLNEMCKIQCTGMECAAILGMDYDTLNRLLKQDGHGGFTDYFKIHSQFGKMSLRRRQYEAANEGSVPMMIWLGKNMLGQTEPKSTYESLREDAAAKRLKILKRLRLGRLDAVTAALMLEELGQEIPTTLRLMLQNTPMGTDGADPETYGASLDELEREYKESIAAARTQEADFVPVREAELEEAKAGLNDSEVREPVYEDIEVVDEADTDGPG